MSPVPHSPGESERGQTLPDFTVAIVIFLLTILFISLFIPQIAQPFEQQERPVAAERISSSVTNSELVDRESAGQLNESATAAFFENSEQEVLEMLLNDTTYSLNITIRDASSQAADSNILCVSDGELDPDCNEGEKLAIGEPTPQDGQSVATTRRTLFADDRDVVIEVGVW